MPKRTVFGDVTSAQAVPNKIGSSSAIKAKSARKARRSRRKERRKERRRRLSASPDAIRANDDVKVDYYKNKIEKEQNEWGRKIAGPSKSMTVEKAKLMVNRRNQMMSPTMKKIIKSARYDADAIPKPEQQKAVSTPLRGLLPFMARAKTPPSNEAGSKTTHPSPEHEAVMRELLGVLSAAKERSPVITAPFKFKFPTVNPQKSLQVSLQRGGCFTLDILKNKQEEIASKRIQTAMRGYSCRKFYTQARAAAIVLTKLFRKNMNMRVTARRKKAAIVIQTRVRAVNEKCRFAIIRGQHRAAIKLQQVIRRFTCSRIFVAKVEAAALINRCLRGMVHRRRLAARISALRAIQSRSRYGQHHQKQPIVTAKTQAAAIPTQDAPLQCTHRARVRGFVIEQAGFTNFVIDVETRYGHGVMLRRAKRRYSQFYTLDKVLQSRYRFLPTLPPKAWCKGNDKEFLTRRARELNQYLSDVLEHRGARECEEIKFFLALS